MQVEIATTLFVDNSSNRCEWHTQRLDSATAVLPSANVFSFRNFEYATANQILDILVLRLTLLLSLSPTSLVLHDFAGSHHSRLRI